VPEDDERVRFAGERAQPLVIDVQVRLHDRANPVGGDAVLCELRRAVLALAHVDLEDVGEGAPARVRVAGHGERVAAVDDHVAARMTDQEEGHGHLDAAEPEGPAVEQVQRDAAGHAAMLDGSVHTERMHSPSTVDRLSDAAVSRLSHVITSGEHLYHQLLAEPYIPIGVLLVCLASAACYGASSALQQFEAQRSPPETTMRLALLGYLLRRKLWLLGNLAGLVAFVLQFLALRHASLALVQPLLVTGLIFALAGGALLTHRWLSRGEIAGSIVTMAGLALFLVAARPGRGDPHGSTPGWILLAALTGTVVVGLVAFAREARRWRALSLGLAAGILGGVQSALIERNAHLLAHGVGHALTTWPPYALLGVALVGLVLAQSAFQAGDIRKSLPALTVAEPITAILIGQFLYSEHIAVGVLATFGEVVGLLLMTAGVIGLAQTVPAHGAPVEPRAGERPPAPLPVREAATTTEPV